MRICFRRNTTGYTAALLAVTFLLLSGCLTGCGFEKSSTREEAENGSPVLNRYSGTIYDCFDTVTTVTAYLPNETEFAALMERIETELTRYHKLYDIYQSYDGMVNLHDVNQYAGTRPVEIPGEILAILVFSGEMYDLTDGNVNIAFGTVLQLWQTAREYSLAHPDQAYIPTAEELQNAGRHCAMQSVILDTEKSTVLFADPELQIDVGAVAKGYSVERIAQGLIKDGFDHILINAGGNVRAIGGKPNGEAWIVGITDPDPNAQQEYIQTVSVNNQAVVTSGDYQRYFVYDGKRYHHVIHKDTLMPADTYRSVTVLSGDSGEADALSTALFNMEYETGKQMVDSLPGVEAIWIK